MNQVQPEEKAMELPIPEEVVTLASEPAKPKPKLIKYYKPGTCAVCNNLAIFFPKYNKLLCPRCLGIKLYKKTDEQKVDNYLPETFKKTMSESGAKSPYGIIYKDPKSDPMFGFPGRNEPCPCGSGNKFKKCCLDSVKDERNKMVKARGEAQRDKAILDTANEFKLVSAVFEDYEEKKWAEIKQEDVVFQKFVNVEGKLE
jgi:SEC-C motif.